MPTTTQHIPSELIEKALALCGKNMGDVNIFNPSMELEVSYQFSIEKFAYFLLSPEFIGEYRRLEIHDESIIDYVWHDYNWIDKFGVAVHSSQSGNAEPLISLLKKI